MPPGSSAWHGAKRRRGVAVGIVPRSQPGGVGAGSREVHSSGPAGMHPWFGWPAVLFCAPLDEKEGPCTYCSLGLSGRRTCGGLAASALRPAWLPRDQRRRPRRGGQHFSSRSPGSFLWRESVAGGNLYTCELRPRAQCGYLRRRMCGRARSRLTRGRGLGSRMRSLRFTPHP